MSQTGSFVRPELKAAIYKRDRERCVYCGTNENLTLDYLTPPSRRRDSACTSAHHPTNLVTTCQKCNSAKGSRTLAEFVEDRDTRNRIRRQRKRRMARICKVSGIENSLNSDPLQLFSQLVVALEALDANTPVGEIMALPEILDAQAWLEENPSF